MARGDYKWNTDSRDERQSDYAQSAYSTSSFEASQSGDARRRAPRKRRSRPHILLGAVVIVIAVSAALLYGVSRLLPG